MAATGLIDSSRGIVCGGVDFREVVVGKVAEFSADGVGGETGAEEGTVERGDFAVVDLFTCLGAAEKLELAIDALADDGGFVGVARGGFEGRSDVAIRDAAGTQLAGDAKFALFANLGALASELFGVAGIVDQAFLREAGDYFLDEVLISAAADQSFLHFVDGMGAAHEDFYGGVVEGGLRVDGARLGEHGGSIEAGCPGSKQRNSE